MRGIADWLESPRQALEDFVYQRILRPLLFTSRFGRKSMMGYADTGTNFDYIYRNKASGYTRFGQLVDQILLNLPACKATRNRKDTIVNLLRNEILRNRKRGKRTRIVDLASGPARYINELFTTVAKDDVEVLCLDIDRRSLTRGKAMTLDLPVLFKRANVVRVDRLGRFADKLGWKPNVVLISGLYEYLEDSLVVKSLSDLLEGLEQDGLLLLITQKSNPSQKIMEKLGRTSEGKSWRLYYRNPENLERWVKEAGFFEVRTQVDPWGMYFCCSARKPANRTVLEKK